MPRVDGVQSTAVLGREYPESEIMIASQNDPEIVSGQARDAGAAGFVVKDDLARRLIPLLTKLATLRTPDGGLAVQAKDARG